MKQNDFLNLTKLMAVCLFFFTIIAKAQQFTDNGIKYEITSPSDPLEVKVIANTTVYTGSITIPSSVTYNSQSYSVVEIGAWAFQNATITSVVLPNSIRTFGNFAFMGCTGLTALELPNSLTTIGSSAIRNCTSLTTINIPLSVTSIGGTAFQGCTGFTSISVEQPTPSAITLGSSVFWGIPTSACLYVPSGSQSLYAAASQWSAFTCRNVLATNEMLKKTASFTPNPAKDFVTIYNLAKGAEVNLYDMTGKLLYQTKATSTTHTLNTSAYKNGVYLLKVDGQTTKLLITK